MKPRTVTPRVHEGTPVWASMLVNKGNALHSNLLCAAALLFLLAFGLTRVMSGQEGGGIITGRVEDPSGAAIADAELTVSSEHQQTLTLETNADGSYTTPSLPIGLYSITVKSSGFQSERRQGINVVVDAHLQINFKLKTGSVNETVTVSAGNNDVNVTSTELGTVFENRPIQELPVNGRSVLALAQLSPGVARNSGQINEGFADRGTLVSAVSINNGPNAANAILIDGQSVVQTYINEVSINPAANAIQQFKVESGTISAEYGFLAGGAISMVTASGSDKFHGQVYEFLRNNAFDARSYFNTYPDPVNSLRYNQYGGSIGGPIGRKTTFFGNYEEYRYTLGNQVIASVPTAEWLRGDFSTLKGSNGKLIPLYDPATTRANPKGNGYVRDPFPGNIIPASRIDPVAQAVNAFYPAPNRTPEQSIHAVEQLLRPERDSQMDEAVPDPCRSQLLAAALHVRALRILQGVHGYRRRTVQHHSSVPWSAL